MINLVDISLVLFIPFALLSWRSSEGSEMVRFLNDHSLGSVAADQRAARQAFLNVNICVANNRPLEIPRLLVAALVLVTLIGEGI
jgi:hypothetical protein